MRAISLPFRFDGYGHVAATTDLSKVWADRVRGVVGTMLGERLMRPTYGSPTPIYLFRNTEGIESVMDVDMASAFSTWLPTLQYLGIDFDEIPDSGTVEVTVRYALPGELKSENSVNVVIEVE